MKNKACNLFHNIPKAEDPIVRYYRRILLLGGAALTMWGLVFPWMYPEVNDPLWARASLITLSLTLAALSWRPSNWFSRHIESLATLLFTLLVAKVYYLIHLNPNHTAVLLLAASSNIIVLLCSRRVYTVVLVTLGNSIALSLLTLFQESALHCLEMGLIFATTLLVYFLIFPERIWRTDQLLQSEQLLHSLLRYASPIIYAKDAEAKYTLMTPSFCSLGGTCPGDCRGKGDKDVFPESFAQNNEEVDRKVLSSGRRIQYEIDIEVKGTKKKLLAAKFPIFNVYGECSGVGGVLTDITESAEITQQLKMQDQALRASANAIAIFDRDFNVLFANPAYCRLMGAEEDEIIGLNYFEWSFFRHPPEIIDDIRNRLERGIPWSGELQGRTIDGMPSFEKTTVTPILNDKKELTHFISVKQDITFRMMYERRLKQSNTFIEKVLHSVADILLVLDQQGRILKVNQTLCETLGYTEQELSKMTFQQICACPENEKCSFAILEQLINDGQLKDLDAEFISLDNENIPVYISGSVVYGEDKEISALVLAAKDMRTAKKMEKYSQLAALLEEKVQERTRDVQELLDQKNTFIAQLGHDLRTPLTPLVALMPLLEREVKSEKGQRLFRASKTSLSYITDLTKKIVSYAQINAPRSQLNIKPVQLKPLLDEILKMTESHISGRLIWRENLLKEGDIVYGDELQLRQLFTNLIDNAQRFTPDGGSVVIESKLKGRHLYISVTDTGVGMNREDMSHAFEMFYKADKSRSDLRTSGLGLAICKRIVDLHEGTISLESDGLDQGTRVVVGLTFKNATKEEPLAG